MGTTVEARNWGMPKTISIHTTTLEIGSSKTIYQKKFVIITISKQKILVNMNGLWLKERKLSTVCEKSEILFKKLHFPLDFFEKVVLYKHRNAVVYDFTLKC